MATNKKTPESIAFGNRLREARLNSNYKDRKALAEKTGVTRMVISDYENGRYNPSGPVLAKLCSALNVDATWLYGLEDQAYDTTGKLTGKHEAAYVAAMKKKQENAKTSHNEGSSLGGAKTEGSEDGDITSTIETLDQLIDALDDLMKVMPGYLVEGSAMREALQGDPNGDNAPAYVSLLSSQPGVVNFYRERTHMRQLAQDGTISLSEYDYWYLGRREKLAQTAVKKGAPATRSQCFSTQGELREAVRGREPAKHPKLKCTAAITEKV